MKLLYLADRESVKRYGESITGDALCSMPQGPVLSTTYDLMKGERHAAEWDRLIRDAAPLGLRDGVTPESLDDLSEADVEIIGAIWGRYGSMSDAELVEYAHSLPEWTDPGGSSVPIDFHTLLKAVGIPDDEACALEAHADERALMDGVALASTSALGHGRWGMVRPIRDIGAMLLFLYLEYREIQYG